MEWQNSKNKGRNLKLTEHGKIGTLKSDKIQQVWDFFSLAMLNTRSPWCNVLKILGKMVFSIEYRILYLAKLST